MKTLNIFTATLLIFAVLFSVPSLSADTTSDPIDLLSSIQYTGRIGTSYSYSSVPYFTFNSTSYEISWDTYIPDQMKSMVLTLKSSSPLSSISLHQDQLSFVGVLSGSYNGIYQYTFDGNGYSYPSDSIRLHIVSSQPSNNSISLISFFGYPNDSFSINGVAYKYYREYYSKQHGMTMLQELGSQEDSLVPFRVQHQGAYAAASTDDLIYGRVEINIYPEQFNYNYLDSLQIQYTASGVNYFSGLVMDRSTNEVKRVLSFNEYNGFSNSTLDVPGYHIDLYNFNIVFDLTGIDLDNCYIQLTTVITPTDFSASIDMQEGFYFSCDWIKGILPMDEVPWYYDFSLYLSKYFESFIGWYEIISDLIEYGVNQLDFFGESIVTSIQNMDNNLVNLNVGILDKLGDIYDAIVNPDLGDLNDATDQMSGMADSFNDANQVLSNSPKPAIEDVNADLSSYVNINAIPANVSFFTVLFSSPLIVTILTVALLLCTASYVFFGKR